MGSFIALKNSMTPKKLTKIDLKLVNLLDDEADSIFGPRLDSLLVIRKFIQNDSNVGNLLIRFEPEYCHKVNMEYYNGVVD